MELPKGVLFSIALAACLVLSNFGSAFGTDKILISKSTSMDKVIFDGKWTFYTEWKLSSWNELTYPDGTMLELRTAHQGNFIYIFIDDIKTTQWEKKTDRATVCLDKDDDKNATDANDYCFVNVLSGNQPVTLQGGSPLALTDYFARIPNPQGFAAAAGISDRNDRYTAVAHPGYEFRIPTDLVGRSPDYGFYVGVYHASTNKVYSWPKDAAAKVPLGIPSPSKWGELVSPDASLPEFQWPAIPMLLALVPVVWFTRKRMSLK